MKWSKQTNINLAFIIFREKRKEFGSDDNCEKEKVLGFQINKIISLEDPFLTLKTLFYFFLTMKVSSWIGDRFILLVILNIFIFYSLIEKRCPHFLFIYRTYVKQIIEGSLGIIECLIPRFIVDKKDKK